MTHPYPPPPIQPFERLNATDGLLINAERWKQAHDYHRHRQNVHYQAINQPGIVCGLGVRVIEAPAQSKARDRDHRWVQVQPGMAIDLQGNVIVVPKPFDYHIDTAVKETESLTVYLVVNYRDPDQLQRSPTRETLQETYRLEETTSPPRDFDVELCRILLQAGTVTIQHPEDVFFPGYNQLDLRHRMQAQSRPQSLVRVAQIHRTDSGAAQNFLHLNDLLRSVEALYPALKGADEVGQVALNQSIEALNAYDLLYLTGTQKLELNSAELATLRAYLAAGGVLFADCASESKLSHSVRSLAQKLGQELQPLASLRQHPLRTRPFLFAALPLIQQQPIQVFCNNGIVLVLGEIAAAWGLDEGLTVSRVMLRTAQEFGVNVLYYAWRRRQLTGLQQEDSFGQW